MYSYGIDSVTKDKRLHAPKNKLPEDIDEKYVRMRQNNSKVNCFSYIWYGITLVVRIQFKLLPNCFYNQ